MMVHHINIYICCHTFYVRLLDFPESFMLHVEILLDQVMQTIAGSIEHDIYVHAMKE